MVSYVVLNLHEEGNLFSETYCFPSIWSSLSDWSH
jgi:hypothetical protein